MIEFTVTDKGPGLKDEVIARMYEAFFSTKVDGLGIGLSLCRSIIESHRGRIKAVNLYNGDTPIGCRFTFTLPVRPPPSHGPRGRHCMSLIPKKGTVYVVDDDEAVRDSLQWLLEGKDYRVKCFDSAESFLARFDPREVACLIADIRMDGMSGLELQDRLLERRSPLPVTFITGHGDVPMAVTTMKKGAEDFIEKPFKEDELVAAGREDARARPGRLLQAPGSGEPRRPALAPDDARGAGARADRRRPAQQADRRRPRHQHQDGGGAPRQHHGKAEREHGRRPAQDRARRALARLDRRARIDGTAHRPRSCAPSSRDRAAQLAAAGHRPASPSSSSATTRPARSTSATRSRPAKRRASARCSRPTRPTSPRPSCCARIAALNADPRCTASWSRCRCRRTSRRRA